MGIGLPELLTAVAGLNAVAPNPGLLPKLPGAVGVVPQLGAGLYVDAGAPNAPVPSCGVDPGI